MSETTRGEGERLREPTAERFAGPGHEFDLRQVVAELQDEHPVAPKGQRQKTLYSHGHATIALFTFETGAGLASHKAPGTVTIHIIDGKMRVRAAGQDHLLGAGGLLVLAPRVEHSLTAEAPSVMLLQVHLEASPSREKLGTEIPRS